MFVDLRPALLACTLLASAAYADPINWDAGSGVFQDASNWFPAEVPDANDLVVLDQDTDGTTITFAADVETLSLEMDRGTFTFELGGHTYLLNDGIAPLNFVGPAPYDLTVRNGTVTAGRADLFADGQLRVESGGMIELGPALYIYNGATVVVGDQGSLALTVLGEGGAQVNTGGMLRVEGGGTLRPHRLFVTAGGAFEQQGGVTYLEDFLSIGGTVSLPGGLLVIGDDPPPGIAGGLVVNAADGRRRRIRRGKRRHRRLRERRASSRRR